jgi:hypothetical protein
MSERFVRCSCQHCWGSIEFDANCLESPQGIKISCPHCGKKTWIFEDTSKTLPPVIGTTSYAKKIVWGVALGIVIIAPMMYLALKYGRPTDPGSIGFSMGYNQAAIDLGIQPGTKNVDTQALAEKKFPDDTQAQYNFINSFALLNSFIVFPGPYRLRV